MSDFGNVIAERLGDLCTCYDGQCTARTFYLTPRGEPMRVMTAGGDCDVCFHFLGFLDRCPETRQDLIIVQKMKELKTTAAHVEQKQQLAQQVRDDLGRKTVKLGVLSLVGTLIVGAVQATCSVLERLP